MGRKQQTVKDLYIQCITGGVEEGYSVYSEFDFDKHKEKYVNYLEVIIDKDGVVHYAVPSHMEKLIKIACQELGVDRDGLNKMVPRKYYCDMLPWLCMVTGAVSVWTYSIDYHSITEKHYQTLLKLQEMGIYKGLLPEGKNIPLAKIPLYPAGERCSKCSGLIENSQVCRNSEYVNNTYRTNCIRGYCKYFSEKGEVQHGE